MSDVLDTSIASSPPSEAQDRAKRAYLRRICGFTALGLFVILTAFAAWYIHSVRSARAEVEAKKKKIRAKGEPVSFADLRPKPVPPEEDGTKLLIEAVETWQTLDTEFHVWASGFYGRFDSDNPIAPPMPDYETHDRLAEWKSANAESLRLMRAAAAKPHCRYPIDFDTEDPISLPMSHLEVLRQMLHLQFATAVDALRREDAEDTLDAIEGILDVSEVLRNEPLVLQQLMRARVGREGIALLIHLSGAHALGTEQREQIDRRLESIASRYSVYPALSAERALYVTMMEGFIERGVDDHGNPLHYAERPKMLRMLAYYLRWMDQFLAHADVGGPDAGNQLLALEQEIAADAREDGLEDSVILAGLCGPACYMAREAGLMYRQLLLNARLALRVDRFYRQHGKLPATLAEIVDESLPLIPPALFSELPPVYRVYPDGFAIYDMGVDQTDDQCAEREEDERKTLIRVVYPPTPP